MTNKFIPLIPNLPIDRREDQFESNRNTVLQKIISNEGIKVPQQNTNTIASLNTTESIGALLYDNETHELKVNINGTFRVVNVT